MFAQYSPLFTSGLLSDSSPASSRAPSPQPTRRRKGTHDSLPHTVSSALFSVYAPNNASEASEDAFYLTFKPSRRHLEQGQSFLSLDLGADMRRSMSLRRKDTVTTTHGRSVPTSPVMSAPPIPYVSRALYTAFSANNKDPDRRTFSPTLRRTSRDSLPRPKPAPSATLPQVPRRFHRPSNLTLSISTYLPEAEAEAGPSSPTASSRHRATNSEPAVMPSPNPSSSLFSPSDDQSYFVFSPAEPTPSTPPLTGTSAFDEALSPVEPLSAPPHITSVSLKVSPSFRSTASVGTRQRNRSAALAALEGRTPAKRRPSIKRNFMSMSDDEDDEDDVVAEKQLLGVLNEEEDVVVPDALKSRPADLLSKENSRESKRTSVSSESKRSKRSTLDSLLSPLTNFIDLRDDSDNTASRSWRSFVEIA
ncbi:hypothetical protein BC629DRAFT_627255 [Irpex lacteus]|nr:hypothetical protein BC629DRAFT_627255 [Irpex lacteus]